MRRRAFAVAMCIATAALSGSTGCGGDSKTNLYSNGGGGTGALGGSTSGGTGGTSGGTTSSAGTSNGGATTSGGNAGANNGGTSASAGAPNGGAAGTINGGTAGATSGGTAGAPNGGAAGTLSGGTAGATSGGTTGAAGSPNGGTAGAPSGGVGGSAGAGGAGIACGNGQLDSGEQCDAGAQNGVTGSGCTSGCQYECQTDADCADTNACNGTETCGTVSGGKTCQSGTPVGSISCYSGAASELTVPSTACKAGRQYCVNGTAGQCIGEVLPSPESCNDIDDNCDGSIDEGLGTISCGVGACAATAPACVNGSPGTCTPLPAGTEICGDGIDNDCDGVIDDGCGCVHVTPNGSDTTGTGSAAAPYRTIAHAVSVAGTNNRATQVCVASGATCPSNANYDEAVTMRDGISVLGGYQATGTNWPRGASCVTTIRAQDANGVVFPATVTSATALDGFTVTAGNTSTNAAITVTGATGAVINNDVVTGGGGNESVGILVQDAQGVAATPLIRRVIVSGGTGSASSIGVLSVNSAPVITNNCDVLDAAGRCTASGCSATVGAHLIRGRPLGNTGSDGAETYAIRLENSPNTVIRTSAVCSGNGRGDAAGIRVSGSASGVVVRSSNVSASGGTNANVNSVGVWMDACAGDSPWLVDNYSISGNSGTVGARADGVRVLGDCHPRIDSNRDIVGGQESSANDAIGVYCGRDPATSTASRCTILDNTQIRGSGAGFPPTSAGVKCDAGACARIERNGITGNQGNDTFGVILDGAATFVDSNVIAAGCARATGIGIEAIASSARIQNNVIRGASSCTGGAPAESHGLLVLLSNATSELDVHSNDVFGGGSTASACTGDALAFDLDPSASALPAPSGIVRNNILDPGTCATAYGVAERMASTDPRIFENNDLSAAGTALYRNEASTNLTTIGAVNALTDVTSSGNISSSPGFVSVTDLHLTQASPCRDTGTSAGAPAADWESDTRPQQNGYDIGADEYMP